MNFYVFTYFLSKITKNSEAGDYMKSREIQMWAINIENAACAVADEYGLSMVDSVFERYGAHGFYDLSPCYFSELFADLEMLANEN